MPCQYVSLAIPRIALLAAVLTVIHAGTPAQAQDCTDYGSVLPLRTGTVALSSSLRAMDASDSYLCYATTTTGSRSMLHWCAIGPDGVPTTLGECSVGGTPVRVIRVSGSRVAVIHQGGSWQVVDFSVPSSPTIVCDVASTLFGADIALADNLVYIAEANGLGIYELTSEGPPRERSRYVPEETFPNPFSNGVISLDLEGTTCWAITQITMADYPRTDCSLVVLDVEDPDAPTALASQFVASSGPGVYQLLRPVRVDGARAYVARQTQIYSSFPPEPGELIDYSCVVCYDDVTGLSAPVFVDDQSSPGQIQGDWLYTLGDQLTYYRYLDGVWREAAMHPVEGSYLATSAAGVWAGEDSEFGCFRPDTPAGWPYLSRAFEADGTEWMGRLYGYGDRVLLNAGRDPWRSARQVWFTVLDAHDPLQLVAEGTFAGTLANDRFLNASSFVGAGDLVYTNSGIWNWVTRTQVGPFTSDTIALIGPALWSSTYPGLTTYELVDPVVPAPVVSLFPDDHVFAAISHGTRAVLATRNNVVIVADISDPFRPAELFRLSLGYSSIGDIAMDAERLFLVTSTALMAYVLAPDGSLSHVGTLAATSGHREPGSLALDGATLYMAGFRGVDVVDVADAAALSKIGTALADRSINAVMISGEVLYAAGDYVHAIRRHCSTSVPTQLSDFVAMWSDGAARLAWSATVDLGPMRVMASAAGREWIVPWRGGFGSWEATDDLGPAGSTVVYSIQILVSGAWLTIAEQSLAIPLLGLRLHAPSPNPFNPETTIRFEIPSAGAVRLSVYDVAGRLIRTLVNDSMSQGHHEASWDGLDASGRPVGSGSYLAQLECGTRKLTVMMGLVR